MASFIQVPSTLNPYDPFSKARTAGNRSNCSFTVFLGLGLAGAWLPTFCLGQVVAQTFINLGLLGLIVESAEYLWPFIFVIFFGNLMGSRRTRI